MPVACTHSAFLLPRVRVYYTIFVHTFAIFSRIVLKIYPIVLHFFDIKKVKYFIAFFRNFRQILRNIQNECFGSFHKIVTFFAVFSVDNVYNFVHK